MFRTMLHNRDFLWIPVIVVPVAETIPAFNKSLTAAGLGPIIANF
jgi:hypothetical protein